MQNSSPPGPLRNFWAELWAKLSALLSFLLIGFYFWIYWNNKEALRRQLKVGAIGILSFSLILLIVEVIAEILMKTVGTDITVGFIWEAGYLKWPLIALFIAAIVFILYYHLRVERRHQKTEYVLGTHGRQFMEGRNRQSREKLVEHALELFYQIFHRLKISCVFIAHYDENLNCLKIDSEDVYPTENPIVGDYPLLPIDDSVSGKSYKDKMIRYVPRLYLPINRRGKLSWLFPHAMKFDDRSRDDGTKNFIGEEIDQNACKRRRLPFKAFLSVPLKCVNERRPELQAVSELREPPEVYSEEGEDHVKCLGVLIFGFNRTDPLDKAEIQIAAFLAMILAAELDRLMTEVNKTFCRKCGATKLI